MSVSQSVQTEHAVAPYLELSTDTTPAPVGRVTFAGEGGLAQLCVEQLREAAQARLPIVLIGHGLIEFDLAILLSCFELHAQDLYALWCETGVVGVIDTLRISKAYPWPAVPLDASGKESFALGTVQLALRMGRDVMEEQFDAGSEVAAILAILAPLLTRDTARSCVLSIHEAVCRMRVLNEEQSTVSRERAVISDVRAVVRHFEARAPFGKSHVFPAPLSMAARQAVRSEAARLGIRAEAVGEGADSSVRVFNLPRSDAVCLADAAAEAVTVTEVSVETEA